MHQIVRIVEVTEEKYVRLVPTSGGWRLVVSHPSHKGRNFYYVNVPAELIVRALHDEGVTTSFARRV